MRTTTTPTARPGLRRSIGLGQGIALYVSAILGAGVLVLPGQAASLAGPASLLAWMFSGVLGVPLALTFAALATRYPDAGGVATYAAKAFGPPAGGVTGWWYLVAGSLGQTIVPLTGGYYLAAALHLDAGWAYPIAAAILVAAVLANLLGMRVSGRIQIGLAVAVAVVLIVAVVAAVPRVDLARLTPFAPHGLSGIGQAVVVLFFAFAGWEAIAHLAEEFNDAARDLRRATLVTIVVVTVLFLAIAAAVVTTGTYGSDTADHLAVGTLLNGALGVSATTAAAIAALVISLGTTNAFIASVSRLGYALAREHWLPQPIAHLNDRGTPTGGVAVVATIAGLGLAGAAIFGWGTQQLVFIPSTLVIAVYLLASCAAVKLLTGRARILAAAAAVLVTCTVPFAFGYALIPVIVAAAALGYRAMTARTRTATNTPPPDTGR